MTELKDAILEVLYDLSDSEMVEVHNTYCDDVRYYDDRIEYMSSFDDMCYGMSPTEIIEKFGDLDVNCGYYVVGIFDVTSFDMYEDAPTTYYEEIAEYCADNDDDLGSSDIRDCIEEWREAHEESEDEEPEYESEEDAKWSNGGEDAYMEHYFEEKYGE